MSAAIRRNQDAATRHSTRLSAAAAAPASKLPKRKAMADIGVVPALKSKVGKTGTHTSNVINNVAAAIPRGKRVATKTAIYQASEDENNNEVTEESAKATVAKAQAPSRKVLGAEAAGTRVVGTRGCSKRIQPAPSSVLSAAPGGAASKGGAAGEASNTKDQENTKPEGPKPKARTSTVPVTRKPQRKTLGELTAPAVGQGPEVVVPLPTRARPAAKTSTVAADAAPVNAADVQAAPEDTVDDTADASNAVSIADDTANVEDEQSHEEESVDFVQQRVLERVEAAAVARTFYDPSVDQTISALDAEDESDPVMVADYVDDINHYLRAVELDTLPSVAYYEAQEVSPRDRASLMDTMVRMHTNLRLLPETLFLAANVADRFLATKPVARAKYALVAVAALLVAAKYEEIYAPPVAQFAAAALPVHITVDELLRAERFVLGCLGFSLKYPNPLNFLRRVSKADDYCLLNRTAAKYILEANLLDFAMLRVPPSLQSAAALYIARVVFMGHGWNDLLAHYSGYTLEELETTVLRSLGTLSQLSATGHSEVFHKYSGARTGAPALEIAAWLKRAPTADLKFGLKGFRD